MDRSLLASAAALAAAAINGSAPASAPRGTSPRAAPRRASRPANPRWRLASAAALAAAINGSAPASAPRGTSPRAAPRRASRPANPRWRLASAAALAAAMLVGFGVPAGAAAATLLDPSDTAGAGRVRLDGTAQLTFSRDLHLEEPDLTVEASARTFGIGGSFGLLDGLDGFLLVGATRLSLEEPGTLGGADFDGEVGFAFGGGLRYRFIDERYFKVGGSVAVTRHESSDGDVTATWLAGDVLLGASLHAFRDVVPFLGMAAGFVDGEFDVPLGRVDFRQEDVVGAFAGVRYAATSQVEASLAGRLFDREELTFSLSFGF